MHILPIYFCTNSSWIIRAAICPEGRLLSLVLSSLQPYRGGWEMIDSHGAGAQLSVPLQQVEE